MQPACNSPWVVLLLRMIKHTWINSRWLSALTRRSKGLCRTNNYHLMQCIQWAVWTPKFSITLRARQLSIKQVKDCQQEIYTIKTPNSSHKRDVRGMSVGLISMKRVKRDSFSTLFHCLTLTSPTMILHYGWVIHRTCQKTERQERTLRQNYWCRGFHRQSNLSQLKLTKMKGYS